MAIRHFDEKFSGWGTQTRDGGVAGLDGYTKDRAEEVAREVRANMQNTRGIIDIKVKVIPMGNGMFQVHNTSTYESRY
jgi:hypothetical protein